MFTSRAPIGLMGGDNVFAYAPNPTGFIDPLGLIKYNPPKHGRDSSSSPTKGPFGSVCGAEGSASATWIVPYGSNRAACQAHDDCYSTCGRSKKECDNEFVANGAKKYAWVLTDVLTSAFQEAYDGAQQRAGCCNDCTQ